MTLCPSTSKLTASPMRKDMVKVIVGAAKVPFKVDRKMVYEHSSVLMNTLEAQRAKVQPKDWEEVEREPDWDVLQDFEVDDSVVLPDTNPAVFGKIIEYMKRGIVSYDIFVPHYDCGFWSTPQPFGRPALREEQFCDVHNLAVLFDLVTMSEAFGLLDLRNTTLNHLLRVSTSAFSPPSAKQVSSTFITYLNVSDPSFPRVVFKLRKMVERGQLGKMTGTEYEIVQRPERDGKGKLLWPWDRELYVVGKHAIMYE